MSRDQLSRRCRRLLDRLSQPSSAAGLAALLALLVPQDFLWRQECKLRDHELPEARSLECLAVRRGSGHAGAEAGRKECLRRRGEEAPSLCSAIRPLKPRNSAPFQAELFFEDEIPEITLLKFHRVS